MRDAAGRVATLWGLRGDLVLVCFRVTVDADGRVVATTMVDLHDLNGQPDCDQLVRARLAERYGPETRCYLALDGGAGFAQFQREIQQGREPRLPQRMSPSSPGRENKQLGLWNPDR